MQNYMQAKTLFNANFHDKTEKLNAEISIAYGLVTQQIYHHS